MDASDPSTWSLGCQLSTAARLVEREWNDWLAGHDLTHAGLLALHALEGGPLTQRQLAIASRVEEQTMSRVVERLQRTGHVTRDRDAADRRRVLVRRTPHGDAAFRTVELAGVSDSLVARRLADPDAFRAELVRLISRPEGGHQPPGSPTRAHPSPGPS